MIFPNPPIENLLSGGEYEPFNFRTRFYASGDGVDTIPASESDGSGWDCRREGFFDGATARVYRVVNGKLINIRNDIVAKHRASGWIATLGDKLVAPDQSSFQWSFQDYNAPNAQNYFTVVAVGKDGTWSKPSRPLTFRKAASASSTAPGAAIGRPSASRSAASELPRGK